jgi:hypothetical protein
MHSLYIDQFQSLMSGLREEWDVVYDDLGHMPYDMDWNNRQIILNNYGLRPESALRSYYFKPQIELAYAESLRMARTVEILTDCLNDFHPETILLIGRIGVADACIHKILYAWQERLNNNPTPWKHILCGEDSDIAQAFISGLEKLLASGCSEAIATQKAMAIAFNAWFASADKKRNCDHDTLNLIDDMVAGLMTMSLSRRSLGTKMLSRLTSMTGENTSYLDHQHQKDILKNRYYAQCDDVINQTHLTQILNDMGTITVGQIAFRDIDLAKRFLILE